MFKRYYLLAVLCSSAAFVVSPAVFSQVPVVDVGEPESGSASVAPAPLNNPQGEMFYQMQLMQQEMMQLRGLVEEQAHIISQLKKQSMERYIDLDKRISGLSSQAPATARGKTSRTIVAPVPVPVPGKAIPSEKDAYNKAYALVTSKRFDSALEAFKQFLVDFPDSQYTPNALYWMGELYQVVQPSDLEAARQAFTQLIERHPDNSKVPDAMYKLGKVYYQKGNTVKSREWLNRVIVEYGDGVSSAADKARKFLQDNF
jgi:tol-pal system protein YbgF